VKTKALLGKRGYKEACDCWTVFNAKWERKKKQWSWKSKICITLKI